MIDRILDNYYTKKLKKLLSRYMMIWLLDKRFIEEHEKNIFTDKKARI